MSDLSTVDGLLRDAAPASREQRPAVEHPVHSLRVTTAGKFLRAGDAKFWVKGVTYGTFRGEGEAGGYPTAEIVDHDFHAMRATGINTVRVYTAPPQALLDAAHRHGLKVMIGLPWEQHIAFLDEPGRAAKI